MTVGVSGDGIQSDQLIVGLAHDTMHARALTLLYPTAPVMQKPDHIRATTTSTARLLHGQVGPWPTQRNQWHFNGLNLNLTPLACQWSHW